MAPDHQLLPPFDSQRGLRERVEQRWRLVGGFIPLPRFPLRCPVCGSADIQLRHVSYHTSATESRGQAPPWRANVHTKCRECSYVLGAFGVVLFNEEAYRAGKERSPIRYDEVVRHLRGGPS